MVDYDTDFFPVEIYFPNGTTIWLVLFRKIWFIFIFFFTVPDDFSQCYGDFSIVKLYSGMPQRGGNELDNFSTAQSVSAYVITASFYFDWKQQRNWNDLVEHNIIICCFYNDLYLINNWITWVVIFKCKCYLYAQYSFYIQWFSITLSIHRRRVYF